MLAGIIVSGFCCFILGIVFMSGFSYHKAIKEELKLEELEKNKPKQISFNEVVEWVREVYKDDDSEKSAEEIFLDWLEHKDEKVNLVATSDPYIQVDAPCVGNECAQSPAREDCCTGDYDHGKCKVVININKLCGIDDVIQRDPKLLTPSEAEMLSKALTGYIAAQKKE